MKKIILTIIALMILFFAIYWIKCQMGINFLDKYTLSHCPVFNLLQKK